MGVRVVLAAAIQPRRRMVIQSVVSGIELRVLAGEDQRRREPAPGERIGNGGELYRFGAGANDENDAR
jgi:hypothetical protein